MSTNLHGRNQPTRSRHPGTVHGDASGSVGESQIIADPMVGQQAQLRVQVLGIVAGLADRGLAVGDWENRLGATLAGASRPSYR